MDRPARLAFGALVVTSALAGCNAIWGLDDRPLAPADASTADVAPPGDDGPGDASSDAPALCPPDPSGYHALGDTLCWSTFDLASLDGGVAGFEGAAFDGTRFLYLIPSPGGVVVRLDTTADFASGAAWLSFDVGSALGLSPSFAGAVFDGKYLTLAPARSSTFVHYDSTSSFTDKASWSAVDPTVGSVLTNAAGYAGGAFDGRFVYFIPNDSTWGQMYDTHAAFDLPPSWSAHHIVPANADAGPGFFGAGFDGRYLYMSPGTLLPDSLGFVLRYDTTGDFTANASFAVFDMTSVNKNAASFRGAAFDGRYVYFAPTGLGGGDTVVVRFDKTGSFASASSWSAFDLATLGTPLGHFFGAAFDGRFLYLAPWGSSSTGSNGMLARYDTTAPFGATPSWSTFDTNSVHAAAFQGSAFDGRFVYFVPQSGTVVARFQARDTPMLPQLPGFFGSFF